ADGNVHQGANELGLASLPRTFALDDMVTPDTTAPTTAVTAPATGASLSGTTTVTASASDDRAVTKVEFYLDNVLQFTDATATYSDGRLTSRSTWYYYVIAYDAAGNLSAASNTASGTAR